MTSVAAYGRRIRRSLRMDSRADMGGYAFGKVVLTVAHSKGVEKPLVCAIAKKVCLLYRQRCVVIGMANLAVGPPGEFKKKLKLDDTGFDSTKEIVIT